ncbi:MAG: hypothetical protein O3C28_12805 [Proteobacteria bacterium]|nr:hypothetical protein [Pseudomonadota bacterium]
MRWIAIIFLLGNVLLLGWQMSDHIRNSATARIEIPPLPAHTPSLRLVSELSERPARRNDTSATADIKSATDPAHGNIKTTRNSLGNSSNNCFSIGPITTSEQLENVRAWFGTRTSVLETRTETVRERRAFWVYLESTSSAEARQNLNDLERGGVTDYMLIGRGELKNTISLGLFRSQDSVNKRLAEMNKKGYKPIVVPKFETTNHYFVFATMSEGHEDTKDFPAALLGAATLEPIDCGLAVSDQAAQ